MTSPAYAGSGNGPANAEAAKRAITKTWEATAAITDADSMAENLHLVDDPTGLVEANRQRATACRLFALAGGVCEPPAGTSPR
jgi:hypothetical protein